MTPKQVLFCGLAALLIINVYLAVFFKNEKLDALAATLSNLKIEERLLADREKDLNDIETNAGQLENSAPAIIPSGSLPLAIQKLSFTLLQSGLSDTNLKMTGREIIDTGVKMTKVNFNVTGRGGFDAAYAFLQELYSDADIYFFITSVTLTPGGEALDMSVNVSVLTGGANEKQ